MEWAPDLNLRGLRLAAELARTAVAQYPDRSGPRLALSRNLIDLGRWDQALACLRESLAPFPDNAELHRALGRLLAKQDALEEALAEVEIALALMPGNRKALVLRFDLLVRLKRWQAAREMVRDIAGIDPCHYALTTVRLSLLPAAERPHAALNLCNSLLAEFPGHTGATYFKALTLAQLGRAEEARSLMRLDRSVDVLDLPAPPAWQDRGVFCQALKEELASSRTTLLSERGKAHHNSRRIVGLRQIEGPAIEALIRLICKAVENYEHIDLAPGRPATARLDIWATNYRSGGYEEPHHHPSGWLSGVYYVSATRLPNEDFYRGSLIMGALDRGVYAAEPPWGTRAIEPVPGRLVLFPSWVPHATEPGGIEGERISVAFDVIPVR